MITTARPTALDAAHLMLTVRPEDNEEWVAATRKPTLKALCECVADAGMDITGAYLDGACLAVWGCHEGVTAKVGHVWLIASTHAMRHVHAIHHHWRPTVRRYLQAYPQGLVGWASEANVKHHAWLERMGFVLKGSAIFGGSFPYRLYYLRGSEPCAHPSLR
jgi:hypothetical protein